MRNNFDPIQMKELLDKIQAEGKNKPQEKIVDFSKKTIETDDNFWEVMTDLKNKLNELRAMAQLPENYFTEQDFMAQHQALKSEFLTFDQHIENRGISFAQEDRTNKAETLIRLYDRLVRDAIVASSKAKYLKVTEELDELSHDASLGIGGNKPKHE